MKEPNVIIDSRVRKTGRTIPTWYFVVLHMVLGSWFVLAARFVIDVLA